MQTVQPHRGSIIANLEGRRILVDDADEPAAERLAPIADVEMP